jgi:iron complex transport system substrate-binding protein
MTPARTGALLAVALAALASCRETAAPGEATRRVVDGVGRQVAVPVRPERIVSLAPSVTDALFALDFGDRVVGVSDFCRPPATGRPIARVGGVLTPALETIRALRPDLLVASSSGNDPGLAPQAEALGLPLYTMHAPDIPGTLAAIRALAGALGEAGRGDRLATGLEERLARVETRVAGRPRPRLLFVVYGEPLVVPGRAAFLTDALRRAGADSITAAVPGAWPSYDLEAAVASAPEVIMTTAPNAPVAARLRRDPAWAAVPAVRRGRVLVVGEAIQQPGPGMIDGIEEVARALHPGVFADRDEKAVRTGGSARPGESGEGARPPSPRRGSF